MMPAFHAMAEASVPRMIACLVEGSAIAIFGTMLLRVLPRLTARVRFSMWLLILLAIALTPFHFAADSATTPSQAWLTVPSDWALYVFAVWAAVASASLCRVIIGVGQIRLLRKHAHALRIEELPAAVVGKALAEAGRKNVAVCTSDRVQVPTAIGFFRPAIVIPSWLMPELSVTELEHLVLHEASHLRRRDDWTNLAQKVLKALLFFQPLVWWIDRQLTQEREMACDDLVLRQTGNPRAYAECLASLAEKSYLRRTLLLAQAAVSRVRQTTKRVIRILNSRDEETAALPRPLRQRWQPVACGVALVTVIAGISWVQTPRLISFSNEMPQQLARRSEGMPVIQAATAESGRTIPAALTTAQALLPRAVSLSAPEQPARTQRTPSLRSVRMKPRVAASRPATPRLVASKAASQSEVRYQTVVLVMTTTDSAPAGTFISWTLCVWRSSSSARPTTSAVNSAKGI